MPSAMAISVRNSRMVNRLEKYQPRELVTRIATVRLRVTSGAVLQNQDAPATRRTINVSLWASAARVTWSGRIAISAATRRYRRANAESSSELSPVTSIEPCCGGIMAPVRFTMMKTKNARSRMDPTREPSCSMLRAEVW
jgi:hypothetical protein